MSNYQSQQSKKAAWLDLSPDRQNSTYKHELRLTGNRTYLGYSKKMGRNEAQDKIYVLKKTIVGILPKYIEDNSLVFLDIIKLSHGSGGQLIESPLLLINNKDVFFSHDFPEYGCDAELMGWIKKLHEAILAKDPQAIKNLTLPKKNYKDHEDELFNDDPRRFLTYEALKDYCTSLKTEGKTPIGRLRAFYDKYLEQHFTRNTDGTYTHNQYKRS